jgi:hypothetical protein
MLNKMEMSVGIAQKMYDCRRAAKQLLGAEYKVKVDVYIAALKRRMDEFGLNECEAVLKITQDPEIANNEMAVIMLMAAAIEISEE